jgi:hypothetical protein
MNPVLSKQAGDAAAAHVMEIAAAIREFLNVSGIAGSEQKELPR